MLRATFCKGRIELSKQDSQNKRHGDFMVDHFNFSFSAEKTTIDMQFSHCSPSRRASMAMQILTALDSPSEV